MAEKVIGGPLDSDVLAQIDLRKNIMKKKNRDNHDLMYLTSRTGWAKLSSGVNNSEGSKLAKEYVLVAGQLGKHGDLSYSNYTETIGFRPMPGILDVEVRSINRFGVLKEATVNFTCWSLTQLTDLEQLYMRPGFTALLEWGHSLYTKDGKPPYDYNVETVQNFFAGNYTKNTIYAEINRLKKQSAYNYDAIFGFVKNFSWSFRADGGYDCTTTLISIGEIVESLQVLLDVTTHNKVSAPVPPTPPIDPKTGFPVMQTGASFVPTNTAAATTSTVTPTTDQNPQATVLQGVLTCIKNWTTVDATAEIQRKYPNFWKRYNEVNTDSTLRFASLATTVNNGTESDTVSVQLKTGAITTSFNYITLEGFCKLINALTLVDQTGEPLSRISIARGNRYNTFQYHESIDPSTCIVAPETKCYFRTFREPVVKTFQTASGGSGDIMDIYLNTDMLLGLLADILTKPAEERSLFNIFNAIFAKVKMALGEINELGLHLDETTHYYHIVDRQVSVENKDLKVLDITGLSSTVSKFDFTTKLSPALTTMIAISAQAGGSDVGVDASALLRWNEGLSDRIITDRKVDRAATTEKDIEDQQTERQKVYASFLQTFYKDKQFDVQKLEEAQRNYSQYAATYMNKYDESKGASGPAGIVPFEVGIDLDGISGIKIGQAFKINEGIMPTKYNGAIGFIITGVSHKISNNKWITSLKAQTITLSGSKPQAKPRKEVVVKGLGSSGNGPISKNEITAYDQAEKDFPGFKEKTKQVAAAIGATEEMLRHIMWKESYLKTTQVNGIGCVGLTQFCPDDKGLSYKTINGTRYQLSAIQNMGLAQLDLVETYFKALGFNSKSPTTAGQLYRANFYPVSLKKSPDWVIGSERNDGGKWARKIAIQNPGIAAGKSTITVADVDNFINS
jgi:hypothetical protein